MATKAKKPQNLTWNLDVTEQSDGDFEGQLVLPKGADEAVVAHLADRSGLTVEQTTRLLETLATTASEQMYKHPNRFFIVPGLGAMQLVHHRARTARSFSGKPVKLRESKSLSFKFTNQVWRCAVRWD